MPGEKNDEVGIKLLVGMIQNYQAVSRLMEDQLVAFEGIRARGPRDCQEIFHAAPDVFSREVKAGVYQGDFQSAPP